MHGTAFIISSNYEWSRRRQKHMYIGVNYTGEISERKYKTMNE